MEMKLIKDELMKLILFFENNDNLLMLDINNILYNRDNVKYIDNNLYKVLLEFKFESALLIEMIDVMNNILPN